MASHIYERVFPARPEYIRDAREFAESVLSDLPPSQMEVIRLLVSELATNAVMHFSPEFELTVNRFDDRIVVAAMDECPSSEFPETADHLSWRVVKDLADDAAMEWIADDGELVWAELQT